MGRSLTFTDKESFYKELFDLESKKEEYQIETGIMEAKQLPLRLVHHIGISKDDIAHLQHKTLAESAWKHGFIEPVVIKINEMLGKYRPAPDYEFTIEAEDYDTIKIHGRPNSKPAPRASA